MMFFVPKQTRLNLRITEEFRRQIEELAEYHGLSLSSYAHSLLVKAVRRDTSEIGIIERSPRKRKGMLTTEIQLGTGRKRKAS